MPFQITLFDLTVLLGFIQGVVMAFLLLFLRSTDKSKNLLVAILLIIVLLSSKILLHTLGLWNQLAFRYFPLAIDTTLQPLLYLYAGALTGKKTVLYKKLLLFIPTIVFLVHALVVYARVLPLHNMADKDRVAESLFYNDVKRFEDWVAITSGIAYWVLSFKRIQSYRQWLFSSQSDTRLAELGWLRNILLTTGLLVLALMVVVVLDDLPGWRYFFYLQVFYVYMAGLTYYLSLKGYQFYHTPRNAFALQQVSIGNTAPDETTPIKPAADITIIKEQIITAFGSERLFLNPELSLKDLARHINCPVATVSAAINQGFQMNFRNLVNSYRVAEVKRRLTDPKLVHLSLLGIALECGFNSEASFYRIFRKSTGLSPNDYIGIHLKK